MSSLSTPHARCPRTGLPGARWRSRATKVLIAAVALAGVGCSSQAALSRGSVTSCFQFGLALTGLLAWISYLVTGVTGLAWAACTLLLPVAGLGMSLIVLNPDRGVVTSQTARHSRVFLVAAHIAAASVTILLAVLAAIGSG